MPTVRRSDSIGATITIPVAFDWLNEGEIPAERGADAVCRTLEWNQGNPEIADFDIGDIEILFYSDSAGTTGIDADDDDYDIGDETLADIITITNFVDDGDGTGCVDIEVDPSGITESELSALRNIYVRLRVNQPPDRDSDVCHVSIDLPSEPPMITGETFSFTGTRGQSFSRTIHVTSETDVTWAVDSGTLPPGIEFGESTGIFSGTPSSTGSYSVVISATNEAGSDTATVSFTISAPEPPRSAPSFASSSTSSTLTVGTFASAQWSGNGYPTPSWSLTSGSLPPGISQTSVTQDLHWAGTPTTAGSYSATFTCSNSEGSDSITWSFTVNEA